MVELNEVVTYDCPGCRRVVVDTRVVYRDHKRVRVCSRCETPAKPVNASIAELLELGAQWYCWSCSKNWRERPTERCCDDPMIYTVKDGVDDYAPIESSYEEEL